MAPFHKTLLNWKDEQIIIPQLFLLLTRCCQGCKYIQTKHTPTHTHTHTHTWKHFDIHTREMQSLAPLNWESIQSNANLRSYVSLVNSFRVNFYEHLLAPPNCGIGISPRPNGSLSASWKIWSWFLSFNSTLTCNAVPSVPFRNLEITCV